MKRFDTKIYVSGLSTESGYFWEEELEQEGFDVVLMPDRYGRFLDMEINVERIDNTMYSLLEDILSEMESEGVIIS
jgi:hypothetical protein